MSDTNLTRNMRDGKITLKDGTPTTPNSLEIVCDMGNLHYEDLREFVQVDDRGALDHVRDGNEVPVPLNFGVKFKEWTASSAANPTPADALRKVGEAASWLSTAEDGEPYAVDIEFEVANPDPNGEKETITFADFRAESLVFDEAADFNTFAASGFAYITSPASVRSAQT